MHSRMCCSLASLSRMHFPLQPSRFPMQRTYMSASILIMPTSYSWLHSYVSSIIPWNQIMWSIFSRMHGSVSFVWKLRNAVWRPSRSQLVPLTHQSWLWILLTSYKRTSTIFSPGVWTARMQVFCNLLNSTLHMFHVRITSLLARQISAGLTIAPLSSQSSVISFLLDIRRLLHSTKLNSRVAREPMERIFGRFRRQWSRWYQLGYVFPFHCHL